MVRIGSGCLLIETVGFEIEDLHLFFKIIVEKGFDKIDVLTKPAMVFARRKGGFTTLYAVPPGSFVICSSFNDLASVYNDGVYRLEKDVWVDTGVLDIKALLSVLNNVLNAILRRESLVLDTGRFRFEIHVVDDTCLNIIVMDSFKIPLYWIGDRLDPLSEDYRELFKQTLQGSPSGLRVLSYAKFLNNGFRVLAGFKHIDNRVLFIINAPEPSKHFLKYITWLLIDIFIERTPFSSS
ncbi:MAG: hypothetical protein QXP72_05595 [Desulfurococcaceae archaeon]